ncbi:MAG: glycosyltransferase family 2 protein [Clostridiales bacterium]|nr:glycosyltransferase family 2 protein [Clostridiales bacterium]
MNIVAVAMMKNEEDIAEVFCRYALGFCDRLIVLDDSSDDRTPEILAALVGEGLPITIVEKSFGTGFYKHETINAMVSDAFSQYGADLVVPLDADEFITTDGDRDVRGILESLRDDVIYLFPWRTYVLMEAALSSSGSVLERFDSHRPPDMETYYKIVVSRKLFVNDGYRVQLGQHDLDPRDGSPPRAKEAFTELVFAHFPIRSVGQASSKIIIGWLNYLSIPGGRAKSFHWPQMYEAIKRAGGLSLEDAQRQSYFYSVLDEGAMGVSEGAISGEAGGEGVGALLASLTIAPVKIKPAVGNDAIELRYTPESADESLRIGLLLSHLEKMIEAFVDEKNKDAHEIASMKASNSWRAGRALTAPARVLKRAFRRKEE